jgi:hypothetical protein
MYQLGAWDRRWYTFLSAIVTLGGVPFVAGFLLLDDALPALLCFTPSPLRAAMYVGPMLSMTPGWDRKPATA